MPQSSRSHSYRDRVVLESLRKCLGHGILVLLLDDAWRRRENTERRLARTGIWRLAKCEENLEQLWPRVIWERVSILRLSGAIFGDALLS